MKLQTTQEQTPKKLALKKESIRLLTKEQPAQAAYPSTVSIWLSCISCLQCL